MTVRIRLAGASGRVRVDLHVDPDDHLVGRVLERGPTWARVALVGIGALLLSGDRVRIEVQVEEGLALELVEVAGTVAYDARGAAGATWDVVAALEADARLWWDGQPFVVADGADVRRHTRLDLAAGAVAVVREQLVLGRSGECGGDLVTALVAEYDGRPLLVEELCLLRDRREDPTQLGGARTVDTLLVLGARALPASMAGRDVLQLEGPGTVVRSLSVATHASTVAPLLHSADWISGGAGPEWLRDGETRWSAADG